MTPEEKELLEDIASTTEENHKMLKKLTRSLFWGRVAKLLYWVIIFGVAIGSFYYLQPYIDQLRSAYDTAIGQLEAVKNVGSSLPDAFDFSGE